MRVKIKILPRIQTSFTKVLFSALRLYLLLPSSFSSSSFSLRKCLQEVLESYYKFIFVKLHKFATHLTFGYFISNLVEWAWHYSAYKNQILFFSQFLLIWAFIEINGCPFLSCPWENASCYVESIWTFIFSFIIHRCEKTFVRRRSSQVS